MIAPLRDYFARRAQRRAAQAPPVIPPAPPPPIPPGWRIVPHATPGVTAYEVTAEIDPQAARQRTAGSSLGGMEFCGTNSVTFHDFPPETLQIGAVGARFDPATHRQSLTYRFDYLPGGWRRPGSLMPACDFNRLPLGQTQGVTSHGD